MPRYAKCKAIDNLLCWNSSNWFNMYHHSFFQIFLQTYQKSKQKSVKISHRSSCEKISNNDQCITIKVVAMVPVMFGQAAEWLLQLSIISTSMDYQLPPWNKENSPWLRFLWRTIKNSLIVSTKSNPITVFYVHRITMKSPHWKG